MDNRPIASYKLEPYAERMVGWQMPNGLRLSCGAKPRGRS
jgi:hypothetical protein